MHNHAHCSEGGRACRQRRERDAEPSEATQEDRWGRWTPVTARLIWENRSICIATLRHLRTAKVTPSGLFCQLVSLFLDSDISEADRDVDGPAVAPRNGPRGRRGCQEEDPVLCAFPSDDSAGPATGGDGECGEIKPGT